MALTEERMKQLLTEALAAERAHTDERFTQQQTWLEAKFEEERAYYTQLIRQELTGLNDGIDRLETKINQVFTAEGEDIQAVTRRLNRLRAQFRALEADVAKLQSA